MLRHCKNCFVACKAGVKQVRHCEWRKEIGNPTQCLHISLAAAYWRCAHPFRLQKHCWSLVQVLESLLSLDHWHRPAKLGAMRTGRVTHIFGNVSFAMFCFFFVCILLEIACHLQKRMAPCKAGVETSCREVHLRKASYAVILSMGRINSLSCWRLAQAVKPVLLKSVGKASATMPASRKQSPASIGLGALHPALAEPIAGALSCALPCHGATLFGCFSAKMLATEANSARGIWPIVASSHSRLALRRADS